MDEEGGREGEEGRREGERREDLDNSNFSRSPCAEKVCIDIQEDPADLEGMRLHVDLGKRLLQDELDLLLMDIEDASKALSNHCPLRLVVDHVTEAFHSFLQHQLPLPLRDEAARVRAALER
eukprot:768699-Hanusia_phi.AAC.8